MFLQMGVCQDSAPRCLLGLLREGAWLQQGSLGIAQKAMPMHMRSKKRRLSNLPTIVEADAEDLEADSGAGLATSALVAPKPQPLPSGLAGQFDSQSLISSSVWADSVSMRLKEAGDAERQALLFWLCTVFPSLAFTEHGSSVAEVACKVAEGVERSMIAGKLKGHVTALCVSPYGHQVLTTFIETMPVSALGFVLSELVGKEGDMARHEFGYRVLEALIRHCSEQQIVGLANNIILETVELSRHRHGNFVVQHLLEYGVPECRSSIIRRMQSEIAPLAMDRVASHVVHKAHDHAGIQDQCLIAKALTQAASPASLADVAGSRCGSAILIEMASIDACAPEIRLRLAGMLPHLVQSKFGRRVLHHFRLMPVVDA